MGLTLTLFGPRHWFWRKPWVTVWFYQPTEHSTGGTGFKVPCVHACFTWGRA